MGRDGRGVRAASKSTILISFTFGGVECRERIRAVPTAIEMIA
ncbi:DUF3596 domain-containing protein [Burkholderia multivorans]|nr:DUF3596 domain-containing protein [Burkholderia multivorans]MBU9614747.1 DUF3596 domain-containing protein [Burkholderia multivorans]